MGGEESLACGFALCPSLQSRHNKIERPEGGKGGGEVATLQLCQIRLTLELLSVARVGQAKGLGILEELQRQREGINRSRDTLQSVDTDLQHSQRLLKTMSSWWPWKKP